MRGSIGKLETEEFDAEVVVHKRPAYNPDLLSPVTQRTEKCPSPSLFGKLGKSLNNKLANQNLTQQA
jgi:hypothetical protein